MIKRMVITGVHPGAETAFCEFVNQKKDWQVFFVGRKYLPGSKKIPPEQKAVEGLGIKYFPLDAGKIERRIGLSFVFNLLKIPLGFLKALSLISKIKPKVVVSFGSYTSVPVVLSAWLLGIPSLTHEQTPTINLSTKINALFVKAVAVSFPETVKRFPQNKAFYTGNPIRKAVFEQKNTQFKDLAEVLSKTKKKLLCVVGGNQGAAVIDLAIQKIINQLTEDFLILHQVRQDHLQEFKKLKSDYYWPVEFIEDMGWALHRADLIVARAGANFMFEFLALEKPVLMIPLTWAQKSEQEKNARFYQEVGLGEVIWQKDLSPSLLLGKIRQMNERISEYKLKKELNLVLGKDEANQKLFDLVKRFV